MAHKIVSVHRSRTAAEKTVTRLRRQGRDARIDTTVQRRTFGLPPREYRVLVKR